MQPRRDRPNDIAADPDTTGADLDAEVGFADRPLVETPGGRADEDDGLDGSERLAAAEIEDIAIGAVPLSEITANGDPGSAPETIDGLDPLEEEVRRQAEDVPTPGRIDD
jgi:hypothetical protein